MYKNCFFYILNILLITVYTSNIKAQTKESGITKSYITKSCIYNGDTIPSITIRTIYIYPQIIFNNKDEYIKYLKLVRDIRKVLPIANMINDLIIETYEYANTLPNARAKKKHMKAVEKGLKEQFTAQMKKLTYRQGQILIKLVSRQSNQSSYELIKAFMGSFKATTYQIFAKTFGSTLKVEYDPYGKDKLMERIVVQILNGQL